jgi:hypothetical protein
MRPTHNKATGLVVYLTHHALERWELRSGGDIEAALREALPFGVSRDNDCFRLVYGDAVFVVRATDDGHWLCMTVLERRHATAEMQTFYGHHAPEKGQRRLSMLRKKRDKRRSRDD